MSLNRTEINSECRKMHQTKHFLMGDMCLEAGVPGSHRPGFIKIALKLLSTDITACMDGRTIHTHGRTDEHALGPVLLNRHSVKVMT